MRQNKELQLIAASVVSESELSKGAKLQLIKFIQYEATDVQVKAILLDGKILTNIDEQTAAIINDRFAVSENQGYIDKLRQSYSPLNWDDAIHEDVERIDSIGAQDVLDEDLTDREKTFLFGRIQRVFGQCAAKCGKIAITSKQRACKDVCIAKRDQAIKAARARAKAAKAKSKGNEKKAAKMAARAKDIEGYK